MVFSGLAHLFEDMFHACVQDLIAGSEPSLYTLRASRRGPNGARHSAPREKQRYIPNVQISFGFKALEQYKVSILLVFNAVENCNVCISLVLRRSGINNLNALRAVRHRACVGFTCIRESSIVSFFRCSVQCSLVKSFDAFVMPCIHEYVNV